MKYSSIAKSVSLTFRGFDVEPDTVERLMNVKASSLGRAGLPVKPGVKGVLKRSFAEFSINFDKECRLDEMIPLLLSRLGGIERIVKVREHVSPEFFEINFTLPIKYSDEQEGGFIPSKVLADLVALECSLSFEFI